MEIPIYMGKNKTMDRKKLKKGLINSIGIGTILYILLWSFGEFVQPLMKWNSLLDFVFNYILAVVATTLIFFLIIYILLAKEYYKDLRKN